MITRKPLIDELEHKVIVFSIILAISVVTILELIPETSAQESILVLQNAMISTSTNNYEISSDFDIRILQNGDLIRVKGTTVDGHPYYVYQKMINEEPTLFGKIFVNGNAVQIVQASTDSQQTKEETTTEKNLIVLVESSDSGRLYEKYRLSVKVYDADINPNPELFSKTDGLLESIPVNATITDKNGKLVASLDGTTDNAGKFEGLYTWIFSDVTGEYKIKLDVDNGNFIEEFTTFYHGYIPPSDST